MKKITLLALSILTACQFSFAQVTAVLKAPPVLGSTTQVRAPNGLAAYAYMRACALVLPSELTNMAPGTSITSFGFTLATTVVMTIPVAGNFTVYLENTSDLTYQKGTNWTTITPNMTSVYASVMTIPIASTTSSVMVTLSTPFTYTGGGIYVAYDWACTGPYSGASNPATFHAENYGLTPGCASAFSATSPAPTAMTTTAFRPSFLFGFANPFTNDIEIVGVEAPGKVNASFNTPHNVKALVKNSSSIAKTNITVNLNVTGANALSNNVVIPTLAAGQASMVSFPFNPLVLGANTVSFSVAGDQNNANNVGTYAQSVTCGTWAQNPAAGNYTAGVGLTAAGVLATPYFNAGPSTLLGLNGAVSSDPLNVGNQVFGILLSSTGASIAVTNTVTITSGQLSTLLNLTFTTPQILAPNTTYHFGFGQTAAGYSPAGTLLSAAYMTTPYFITGPTGGALTPLPQSFSHFDIEGVFSTASPVSVSGQTISCGNSATLAATAAGTYSWNTNATTSSIVVTPVASTNYSVNLSNLACPSWSMHSVNVTPFSMPLSANNSTLCAKDLFSLNASGATSYTYASPTSTVFTAALSENPLASGVYTVMGSNPNGCSATNYFTLTVNPLPLVTINTPTLAVCLGNSVTLTASGNATAYLWSQGPTTGTVTESPLVTTTYSLLGTSNLGCVAMQTVQITVNSFTPGITSSTAICQGTEITLTATGGNTGSYNWSGFMFPAMTVTPSSTTTYSVRAIGANGCAGTNSTTISVDANPTVTAVPQRSVMCKGETNTLTATGAATYSWSTNSTNATSVITPTVNLTLTYTVTGTNNAGCANSMTVNVKVNSCTGIEENKPNTALLHIFPNPNSGLATLNIESFGQNTTIRIYNALGALVKEQAVNSENTVLDIQNETKGVYFVHVLQDNRSVSVSRIIKN